MKKPKKRIANTNQLYYGDEPVFPPQLEPHSNITIISALSYYNVQLSRDDAKAEVIKYATQHYTPDIIKSLDKIQWVCNVGAMCRMYSRGCIFSDELIIHKKIMQLLDNHIDKPVENVIIKSIKKETKKKIEESIDMTHSKLIIDYIEDEALRRTFIKPSNLQKFLDNNKVPVKSYKNISEIVALHRKEVDAAYNKTDAAIVEGYSTYGKKELRLYLELYNYFVDGLLNNVPKRKPRKCKPIDPIKKVSKVKFQKNMAGQYLPSIDGFDPINILGKNTAILYNTKYKTISVLVGNNLDIKGTTIYGFDSGKSVKKILRQPELIIDKILGCNDLNGILNVVDSLSTKQTVPVGTLNSNTLILRLL